MNDKRNHEATPDENWASLVASYRAPQPRSDLIQHIRAARLLQQQRKRRRWQQFAGIAAILALLPLLLPTLSQHSNDALHRFNAVNQPQQLRFLVQARESHDQVTFSLKAPEQWAFYGYPGQPQLTWNGRLKAGANLLSIPMIAHKAVPGTLVVTISHKDAVKEYKIQVDVAQQQV